MTWIRFGRNEPLAPAGPLLGADGAAFDLRAYGEGAALLIFFAPRSDAAGCAALLEDLAAVDEAEGDARSLVVLPARGADGEVARSLPVAFDQGGRLLAAYRGLLEFDTGELPLLFVLDRDGAPVYAWVGGCEERGGLRGELARRLQSAAFLCPECSVPDPAAPAMWEAVY
jgi:hypothetical protein